MKKWIPWILVAVFAVWVVSPLRPKPETGFHTREFGKLPVLMDGRFQPFDSVARNSLLQIRTKQTVPLDNGADAVRHRMAARSDDEAGAGRRPENLSASTTARSSRCSSCRKARNIYSFNQLRPQADEIEKQAERIEPS